MQALGADRSEGFEDLVCGEALVNEQPDLSGCLPNYAIRWTYP
jgi:hypothetical protein